jgi:KGK domain
MENGIKIDGISEKSAIAIGDQIFKFSNVLNAINEYFSDHSVLDDFSSSFDRGLANGGVSIDCQEDEWIKEGVDCEVLQPNSSDWQKGNLRMKISVSFEFTPEINESEQQEKQSNSDSPLDEIRQMIN